jgi:hypothetical protein
VSWTAKQAREARKKYYTRSSQGLCAYCGENEVHKRRICKPCVKKQMVYQERYILKKYGIHSMERK